MPLDIVTRIPYTSHSYEKVICILFTFCGVMVEAASSKAIGVFDSGVGGLTVVNEIRTKLPSEHIIYLGDTARVPYGTRSPQTVQRYALSNTDFLLTKDIKLLVIACNTASAVATEMLQDKYDIPVIDVIRPGARAAVEASRTGRIGIIGTDGTIASGSYQKEIRRLEPGCSIFVQSCPMFVPLAENGWCSPDDDVVLLTARRYLDVLAEARIDTLVLGCTHYPLLKNTLADVLGDGVTLVDSAEETARTVAASLKQHALEGYGVEGQTRFFVSDVPTRFERVGSHFLGHSLGKVEQVSVD